MKYIVYLTTNIKNQHIYVGVHKTENPEIFDGYIGNGVNRFNPSSMYNSKAPFCLAVQKYGFDSFKRAIIKIFDTEKEALNLEGEIVNEDFINRNDTYNIALGGGLPPINNKIIYQYDLNGNFIKEWSSIREAAKFYNCSETCIGNAVILKRMSQDYFWADKNVNLLDINEYTIYSPKIPVYIYNKDTKEFYKGFESLSDCTSFLEDSLYHVQRAIKLGRCVKGYYISLQLTPIYECKIQKVRLTGKVHQYSLDGKYIQSFNSIKEAERELQTGLSEINNSIKLNQQCKGFLWRRGEKEESVPPHVPSKSSAKKVGQYTMDDKLIKIFDTVREARKEFPNVSKVLKGQASHCHNFKFKYIE